MTPVIASASDVQHNTGVKPTEDGIIIRRATLADLPLLLQYRRAMANEMDGANEAAVNRMLAALEPYLRAAFPEGRWHAWIADPGGCVGTAAFGRPAECSSALAEIAPG